MTLGCIILLSVVPLTYLVLFFQLSTGYLAIVLLGTFIVGCNVIAEDKEVKVFIEERNRSE